MTSYISMNDKTHFIAVTNNFDNSQNIIGTKLLFKTNINKDDLSNHSNFNDINKNRNRVILSSDIGTNELQGDDDTSSKEIIIKGTLITNQNLYHNIKFINLNNELSKPRILFLKYNITDDISNNEENLYDSITRNFDVSGYSFNVNDLNIRDNSNNDKMKYIIYNLNYYKNYKNSDYYNIKLSDFVNLNDLSSSSIGESPDINKLSIKINNIDLSNNYNNNNQINYNSSDFSNIYSIDNTDISIIDINNSIDLSNDNLLLYNKLDNITTLNLTYKYESNNITNYTNIDTSFIVLKNYDYYTNKFGKIYLNKKYFSINSKILGYNNNFYTNNNYFYNLHNSNGTIFLSLGNGITGLTQNDFKKIKIDLRYTDIISSLGFLENRNYLSTNKIIFSNNLQNTDSISDISNYLIDNNYNYDYTNIFYTIITYNNNKVFDLDISDLYYVFNQDFSNNLYYSKYKNYEIKNNKLQYFNNSYDINNENYNISEDTIKIDDKNYRLTVNNNNSYNFTSNTLQLDFRFNYSQQFDVSFILELIYNDNNNDIIIENFYNLLVNNYIKTTQASDFTNIDCIFIYHDPDKTTDPLYLYPNNNIEIIRNPNIDTLEKAIVNLPELKTSSKNYTFIPAKNGSNLSRKQIQGLIGINDVPKLLSIQPYDPSFIDGRGFINQYKINDSCLSDSDKVKNKINIYKNNEKKINKDYIRKKQFANLVTSRARNKIKNNKSITELSCNNIINYPSSKNYYTPFTLFKTGRGNYLGPK